MITVEPRSNVYHVQDPGNPSLGIDVHVQEFKGRATVHLSDGATGYFILPASMLDNLKDSIDRALADFNRRRLEVA